jgi:tRNA(fMet)-specific endonuclease VapC
MALIVDADVIIRGERGFFDLPTWLEMQADKDPQIAAITVAELWHGVERATASYKPRREDYLRMIFDALPIVPYTKATALEHARIWAALESSGKMIGVYDLIVAATALERKCAVATFQPAAFRASAGIESGKSGLGSPRVSLLCKEL